MLGHCWWASENASSKLSVKVVHFGDTTKREMTPTEKATIVIHLCSTATKGKEKKSMHSLKVLRHGSHSFTCKLHHDCLSFVSIYQMAPPITEVADIQLHLATHLSTPKGWKAELAWLVDLYRTVYPHKLSPVSYRSIAGQGKFIGQRLTFYRCATQPADKPSLLTYHLQTQTHNHDRMCVISC